MKKYMFVLLITILSTAVFASCAGDAGPLNSTATLNIPAHNSSLIISNVRVRGFTLSWDDLPGGGYYYAIAASRTGGIETYEEALENDHVILDFTPASELNGTFRVHGLLPGQEYQIKLFARRANTRAAEFLTARTALPFLDGVELMNVWFDGEPAIFDRRGDSFTKFTVPTLASLAGEIDEDVQTEFTVTYRLAARCIMLDANGEPMPEEFTIRKGEEITVTVIHERTNTARDYLIAVRQIDNGLPVMILETEDMRPIVVRREYVNARMKIFDSATDPYREGIFENEPVDMIMRTRGSVAVHRPKRSFIVRTPDGERMPILDMPEGEDWVLLSNFTDKTLMRNFIAHELFRDMGAIFSPRMRFVDVVFNGSYAGTYMIGERVRIAPGRFDLPRIRAHEYVRTDGRLTRNRILRGEIVRYDEAGRRQIVRPASTPEELTGSYVLELKSTTSFQPHEIIFETNRIRWNRGSYFRIRQPGPNNLTLEAFNYISTFVNEAENALFSEHFTDPETGYRAFLDTATFIDWYIVNELFKRLDSDFTDNIYFYKPRDGLLSMGPVWDFEFAAGNHAEAYNTEGWHVRGASWFTRLFECETFEQEFTDRWNHVKANYFDRMFALIDSTAERLEISQQVNFTRWPILGVSVWPNPPGASSRTTFQSEVDYLKDWLTARIEWMDSEINGE